jgi:hypothetical protein
MKTKKVEYFVDLYPNWQDWDCLPCMSNAPHGEPPAGGRRVRVVVELPCIGGKDAVTETYHAESREVKGGFTPSA